MVANICHIYTILGRFFWVSRIRPLARFGSAMNAPVSDGDTQKVEVYTLYLWRLAPWAHLICCFCPKRSSIQMMGMICDDGKWYEIRRCVWAVKQNVFNNNIYNVLRIYGSGFPIPAFWVGCQPEKNLARNEDWWSSLILKDVKSATSDSSVLALENSGINSRKVQMCIPSPRLVDMFTSANVSIWVNTL